MKRLLLVESFFSLPLSVILWTGSFVRIGTISPRGGVSHPLLSSALEITPSVALISNSDCMQMPWERSVILKGQRVCARGGEQRHSSFLSLFFSVCRLMLARSLSADMSADRSEVWRRQRAARGRIIIYIKLAAELVRRLHWEFLTFSFIRLVWPWALFAKGVLLVRLVVCCCFCAFESALSWKMFRKGAGKTRRRGEYSFNRDCRGDLEHGSGAQHLLLQGKTLRTRHSSNASKWK